jgi:hypothetical protein
LKKEECCTGKIGPVDRALAGRALDYLTNMAVNGHSVVVSAGEGCSLCQLKKTITGHVDRFNEAGKRDIESLAIPTSSGFRISLALTGVLREVCGGV